MTHPPHPADLSSNPRFQRDVSTVHGLGVRATAELLAEFAALLDPIDLEYFLDRLAAYRAIPQEHLTATGGDTFPAIPLRVVKSHGAD